METPVKDHTAIGQQYESWPYPRVPQWANVRPRDVWQANLDYLRDRCGRPPAPEGASLWIAGCGTFEPYVFTQANPRARVLATDRSGASLRTARRRCQWHGVDRRVAFESVDLADASTMPGGPFDLIECYGVLMNLPDPAASLRAMRDRLAPDGILRLMVYPHFSRQRIFWIQRVARALGLTFRDRSHPAKLRAFMKALPVAHPLRRTFVTYPDARNDAGIVDGFLHAGDRGFTGLELGSMLRGAGLRAAHFVHRPWGQPEPMAAALGMERYDPFSVLHYLDLWQELRTNFIVCAVRDDASPPVVSALRPHPLFTARGRATPVDTLSLHGERWLGCRLPSRTEGDPLRMSGKTMRRLRQLAQRPEIDPAEVRRLARLGLLLGGDAPTAPAAGERLPVDGDGDPGVVDWRVGDRVENPLHAALHAAWSFSAVGTTEEQLARWESHADPLEDEECPFGLTPFGSAARRRAATEIAPRLENEPEPVAGGAIRDELRRAMADMPLQLAVDASDRAVLDLWAVICRWRDLVVTTDQGN